MNLIRVYAGFVCALSLGAVAGVYDNVYFWSRGMATDANGDGVLQKDEIRDSINGRSGMTSGFGGGTIVYTNEWAHLPYRGTTNFVSGLYLGQTVTVTNEETGAGYGYPASFTIPSSALSGVNTNHYAIFIRFRPDSTQPHPSYTWLFNFGHVSKKGLMVGFNSIANVGHSYGGTTFFTNRLANLLVYYGGYGWPPNTTNAKVALDNWNDLVISVDGQKISTLLSRDGYAWGFSDNYKNSSGGGQHTTYYTTTAGADYNLTPNSKTFIIGTEQQTTAKEVYKIPASGNSNAWKAFRGTVQCLAIWTNSLTEAEMREAAAWPRMEKWQLGLDNASAQEFSAAAAGSAVDVEGDLWAVPPLAAGESYTIRFPLDGCGDEKMSQFFRLKSTLDSALANVSIKVNGQDCPAAQTIQPGRQRYWYVDSNLLLGNATNTITVTRTDSGAGVLKTDVAKFGGAVQYGEANGNTYELSQEGQYQNREYNLIGANWFDGNRAVFGYGGSSSYSNQVVRFVLPEDTQNRPQEYEFAIRVQNGGTHRVKVDLNGHTLLSDLPADNTIRTTTFPVEYLLKTNVVKVSNTAPFVSGSYFGLDFFRITPKRPSYGTMLLLR